MWKSIFNLMRQVYLFLTPPWKGTLNIIAYIFKSCVKQKKLYQLHTAPLNIITTETFEPVSSEFLHLDRSKGRYEYILDIVDNFSTFEQAYSKTNKSGRTVPDKIFHDFIPLLDFPKQLHHDQGVKFENHLFKRLHQHGTLALPRQFYVILKIMAKLR